jgi:hypothetical protein
MLFNYCKIGIHNLLKKILFSRSMSITIVTTFTTTLFVNGALDLCKLAPANILKYDN